MKLSDQKSSDAPYFSDYYRSEINPVDLTRVHKTKAYLISKYESVKDRLKQAWQAHVDTVTRHTFYLLGKTSVFYPLLGSSAKIDAPVVQCLITGRRSGQYDSPVANILASNARSGRKTWLIGGSADLEAIFGIQMHFKNYYPDDEVPEGEELQEDMSDEAYQTSNGMIITGAMVGEIGDTRHLDFSLGNRAWTPCQEGKQLDDNCTAWLFSQIHSAIKTKGASKMCIVWIDFDLWGSEYLMVAQMLLCLSKCHNFDVFLTSSKKVSYEESLGPLCTHIIQTQRPLPTSKFAMACRDAIDRTKNAFRLYRRHSVLLVRPAQKPFKKTIFYRF